MNVVLCGAVVTSFRVHLVRSSMVSAVFASSASLSARSASSLVIVMSVWLLMLLFPSPVCACFLLPTAHVQLCQRRVGLQRFCQRTSTFILNQVFCLSFVLISPLFPFFGGGAVVAVVHDSSSVLQASCFLAVLLPTLALLSVQSCSLLAFLCCPPSFTVFLFWPCKRLKSKQTNVVFARSALLSARAPHESILFPVLFVLVFMLRRVKQ